MSLPKASRRRRPARRRHSLGERATTAAILLGVGWILAQQAADYLRTHTGSAILAGTVLAAGMASVVAGTRKRRIPARRRAATGARTLAAYRAMEPTEFEHTIADLAMRSPDVLSAEVQGGANDRALDVLVRLTDGRRVMVQCKRYADGNNVGAPTLYEVNGTCRDVHRCDLAVIVTTSSFTRQAVATNAQLGQPIRLVDGPALERWTNGGHPPWRTAIGR